MPTAKLVQIESWSFSRKQNYDQCPRRAKFLYVDKLREPDAKSPALAKGTRVHALAAAWVTKRLPDFDAWDGKELLQYKAELEKVIRSKTIPLELARFEEEFRVLIKAKARCEEMWNLGRDWRIIPGKDYNPNVWLRVKVDSHYIQKGRAVVHDYKTGKYKPDHAQQREIYAIAALEFYPDAESVTVYHDYLDQGVEMHDAWDARDLSKLKVAWERRTAAMLKDTTFEARPSPDNCRWCTFKKSLGGPCEF
jgi:ATP-dependent exoDNAse (exonuclease V) beta subunit